MGRWRARLRTVMFLGRIASVAVAVSRLVGVATRRPALAPVDASGQVTISVLIPARDEAARVGPLLDVVARAPGVDEVVVIDDCSSDSTAQLAESYGVTVWRGTQPPPGWLGKPWALQQGLAQVSGEWVVCLDADVRPGLALVSSIVHRALVDDTDLLTVAGRFDIPSGSATWLHAAMLNTLVYRFGPPGRASRPQPTRTLANGQCMAFRRDALVAAGGFATVADRAVEDVALARTLAARGWRVDFLDASSLLAVRAYESFAGTWVGWGRSLGLRGVESGWRQCWEVAMLVGATVLPPVRLMARRADPVDLMALSLRVGVLAGTRASYRGRGVAFWASPLADGVAVAALCVGLLRPAPRWRGRSL